MGRPIAWAALTKKAMSSRSISEIVEGVSFVIGTNSNWWCMVVAKVLVLAGLGSRFREMKLLIRGAAS